MADIDLSGLPRLVLTLARIMCWILSLLLILVMVIMYWAKGAVQKAEMTGEDWKMMALLGAIAIVGFVLAYFIGKEIKRIPN